MSSGLSVNPIGKAGKKSGARRRVFVAMSGGVDSSVAAALLKKDGYEVTGVFMKNWSRKVLQNGTEIRCTLEEDYRDALAVARKLEIPLFTFDFEEEYRRRVFRYFIDGYQSGLTPNPDVLCNKEIKFGLFLRKALALGADYMATGHYVRKSKIQNSKFKNIYGLFQAKDKNKDQSYFLCMLTQEQIKHCLFPIGDYTKDEVRKMARDFGLATAEKKDSQGLCFVGKISVPQVLDDNFDASAGPIISTDGETLGRHRGFEYYTIGQRRGLALADGPYYVAEKRKSDNAVIVAKGADHLSLRKKEVIFRDAFWIYPLNVFPFEAEARIRHRQRLIHATVEKTESNAYRALLKEPSRAVAPGQMIVFYRDEEMLGGGVMC